MELWLTVNGKRTCASAPLDPLTRAVVISMFTWRRAEPDDNADVPMGWWGIPGLRYRMTVTAPDCGCFSAAN